MVVRIVISVQSEGYVWRGAVWRVLTDTGTRGAPRTELGS